MTLNNPPEARALRLCSGAHVMSEIPSGWMACGNCAYEISREDFYKLGAAPEAREVAEDVYDEQAVQKVYSDAFEWFDEDGTWFISLPHIGEGESSAEAWKDAYSRLGSKLKPEPTPTQRCEWTGNGMRCVRQKGHSDQQHHAFPSLAEPTPVRAAPGFIGEYKDFLIKAHADDYVDPSSTLANPPVAPVRAAPDDYETEKTFSGRYLNDVYPPVATVRAADEFLSVCEGECEHPYCWSQKAPVAPERTADPKYKWDAEDDGSIAYEHAKFDSVGDKQPEPTMEPQELHYPERGDMLYSRNKWHMICNGMGWPAESTNAAAFLDAIRFGQTENVELKEQVTLALARAEKAEADIERLKAGPEDPLTVGDYRNECHKMEEFAKSTLAKLEKAEALNADLKEIIDGRDKAIKMYGRQAEYAEKIAEEFTFSNLSGSTTTIDIETAQKNYGRHMREAKNLENVMMLQSERVAELKGVIREYRLHKGPHAHCKIPGNSDFRCPICVKADELLK